MWETFIVQPIFNLLVFVYAVIPGHDFGLAIIIFTILIRVLMWPLVKKQLHHSRAMRELQPEIQKIKQKSKGDKQKESQLLMELYKEREINPFSSIGILFVQIPILIGLFQGMRKITNDPSHFTDFTYGFIKKLGILPDIINGNVEFQQTLFGFIDLSKTAISNGSVYIPLLVLAIGAVILQFYQSKQLMPEQKDSKTLRQILKEESQGKKNSQSEINAAMGRNMRFFFPLLSGFFAATFPGSLALYWTASSAVAVWQQKVILNKDVEDMEKLKANGDNNKANQRSDDTSKPKNQKTKKKKRSSSKKKKG